MKSYEQDIQEQIQTEWKIMKSISKNWGGADLPYLGEDLKESVSKQAIIEGVKSLTKAGIITYTQYQDYIFTPGASTSPLIRALKKRGGIPITVDEYQEYGWRKLARLI